MNLVGQIKELIEWLFKWWVTIAPWQQGVRVRAGKHASLLMPGIHLRIPLLDEIFVQPVRKRAHYVEAQTITSRDGKSISVGGALQYEVSDILKLYRTMHNAHDTISQKVQRIVQDYVSHTDFRSFNAVDLEAKVLSGVNLGEHGIIVRSYSVTNFSSARLLRLITGESTYTGYTERLNTTNNGQ